MAKQKGCKVSGAELKRFWKDPKVWDGRYYEDACFIVDGHELDMDDDPAECEDDVQVVVIGGIMVKHDADCVTGPSLESALRAWLKRQTTAFVWVEVAKDRLDALVDVVKANGGKVVK